VPGTENIALLGAIIVTALVVRSAANSMRDLQENMS
jgi:hypothetical protein